MQYAVIGEDLEVTLTSMRNNTTIAKFKKPDSIHGYKIMECVLPSYAISSVVGFTQNEVAFLMDYCKNNVHLMLRVAKAGGVDKVEW